MKPEWRRSYGKESEWHGKVGTKRSKRGIELEDRKCKTGGHRKRGEKRVKETKDLEYIYCLPILLILNAALTVSVTKWIMFCVFYAYMYVYVCNIVCIVPILFILHGGPKVND